MLGLEANFSNLLRIAAKVSMHLCICRHAYTCTNSCHVDMSQVTVTVTDNLFKHELQPFPLRARIITPTLSQVLELQLHEVKT